MPVRWLSPHPHGRNFFLCGISAIQKDQSFILRVRKYELRVAEPFILCRTLVPIMTAAYYHCDTEHCYLPYVPSIFLVTFFLYPTFFAHAGKKIATISGCRFLLCGCLTSAYAVFRFGCCSGHFMPKWSSIALRVSDSALVVVPDFS